MILVNNPGSWSAICWPLDHAPGTAGHRPTSCSRSSCSWSAWRSRSRAASEQAGRSADRRCCSAWACSWPPVRSSISRPVRILASFSASRCATNRVGDTAGAGRARPGRARVRAVRAALAPDDARPRAGPGARRASSPRRTWARGSTGSCSRATSGNRAAPRDPGRALGAPAIATTLLGSVAGSLTPQRPPAREKTVGLLGSGVVLILVGLAWHPWFPINRACGRLRAVLFTAGMASYLFGLVYWIADARPSRVGAAVRRVRAQRDPRVRGVGPAPQDAPAHQGCRAGRREPPCRSSDLPGLFASWLPPPRVAGPCDRGRSWAGAPGWLLDRRRIYFTA